MSGKYALIIANTEYSDPALAQLTAPGRDAKDFGQVLNSPDICGFDDVLVLVNETSHKVAEAIDYFLSNRRPDDLVLLYFSGHGVRDEFGALYLAVKNTNRARLRISAIKSDFIREAMDQSRSRRQVLILDCCNSGAFSHGTKAATGVSLGTASAFEAGFGRIILTASDSTQYAWEGDNVIGETDNSLFTHFLVEGLEGIADLNSDGQITVDELYEYAFEKVKIATPKQTPSKFSSKQQGEIVLRENISIEDIKAVPLPPELINAIENPLALVREGAVGQLERLLGSRNLGLARSARESLERIEKEDDSRRVSHAATQALEAIRQAEKAEEERNAREEAERIAARKAEEERIALEKAEAERRANEASERLLAEQKAEEERKAKKEARRLAALKAKEERIAREKTDREAKAEAERKAKEEAERLLAQQKVEEERRAKEEKEAREEAERIAKQKAEQERLTREKAEAERKAKQEAEKSAREKAAREAAEQEEARLRAERDATEKEVRKAAAKVAKEKTEREAAEKAAREKAKEEGKVREKATVQAKASKLKGAREVFVYISEDQGTPLYQTLPAANNWKVWLEKGAKLTLIKPNEAETSIGKYGHYIEVLDKEGNEGYVRAATVSIEPEFAKETVKEETVIKNAGDRIDAKAKTKIEPFIVPHEDSIWKVGRQEILRGLVGAILFAIVGMFTESLGLTIGLRSSILVFFSIAFGPWVGLLTGVLGHIGHLIYLSYFP